MSNREPDPAPPLDLDAFAGYTPGPLFVNRHDGQHGYIVGPGTGQHTAFVVYGDGRPNAEADATLYAAAPALLAECRRQRHLLDAFAASVQDMLDAWDDPTSASVSMRCSAIAGLRGIMEYWSAGATDPEVTRLNAELTRLRAKIEQLRALAGKCAHAIESGFTLEARKLVPDWYEIHQEAARAALAGRVD